MMRWIVGSSLKFRGLVVAIAAGVLVLGITQLPKTSVDTLPEFKRPTVEVQTEALGLSAEEVEQFVTVPLEQDLLVGIAFLDEIESVSLPGLSSVVMTFEPGTDVLDARQVVGERLTQAVAAAGLPEVAKPPQMLQPLSSTSRVAMVRLTPDGLSPIEISVLARWVISPRLLGVPGVANVSIWGQRERQLQVMVDPERLRDRGVTLNQVIRSAGNALEVSPLTFLEASSPGTGGWIDTVNQRLNIFHEQAINTPEELAQIPLEDSEGAAIFQAGEPVTLGEVTDVVEDHQPLIGDALCPGDEQCLLLVIEKFPGADTPEVARGLEEAVDAMRPGLPGMQIDTSIYRPAEYVESSFDNLGWALLIGWILLVVVLGILLFAWRTTLIAALGVPLALAAAGLVLYFRETPVNLVIVAGLLAAVGVVVYDAVLDVEHLARRVRRHRTEGGGAPVWRTIAEASLEMRTAALYAGLIIIAAALPFFFLEREAGAFLPPIAVSFVLAVAASMLVALTVTPALGMLLLSGSAAERRGSPVVARLQGAYDRIAPRIVPRTGPAFIAFGVVIAVGLVAVPFLDASMQPSLKERDVLVHLDAPPGTSLPAMDEMVSGAVEQLATLPGVRDVGAHVGRAVSSDQIVNVNSGEIWVHLDPSADYEETIAAIEDVVGGYPDLTNEVSTYSGKRVIDVLGGTQEDLVVRVYGEDPAVLQDTAGQVRDAVAGIEGLGDPRIAEQLEEPVIEVEVDTARAQAFGVKPGDARRAAAVLLSGITVGNLFEEQKVFDVVVWGAPGIREQEEDVRNLLIDTPAGGHVRMGDIADIRTVPNPTVIRHESVATYLDVVSDVSGRDAGAVVEDVERALGEVEFPLEYHAELLGSAVDGGTASTRILVIAVAAAIAVFLLLQAAFLSWRVAALAFVTLPIGLAGGTVAALLAGGRISLGSVAGFFAVLGIAARGTLVLIRRYQWLERREGDAFGPELIVRGTREQLGSLVTAAVATIAILLPFLVGAGGIGFELARPTAIVVLGGLVTSTVLHLVVVPALYLRFGFVSEPDTTAEDLVIRIPEVEAVPRS